MAVYHTVDGQPYSVTAGTDVQVSDEDGLILGVSAGGQGSFVGNGGDVTITGDHHFVQIKGGGGGGGNGGGGGGGGEPVAPTPEPLVDGTELKHGGVYTVAAAGNPQSFGNVTVESNATAEIWITCSVDNSSVELPGSSAGWIWLDDMPDMKAGKTYGVAARNVGNAVIARPIYEYTTPAQS